MDVLVHAIVYVVHRAPVPRAIKFLMLDMAEPCRINLIRLERMKPVLQIKEVASNVNNTTLKFFM